MEFIVSTGIECSAPRIASGRRDQLKLTGHETRFEEDFDLVVDLGVRHLRYGVPFHLVAHDPEHLDWSWTDRAFAAMQARGIEPIADLLHFGVPDDLTGFGDPRLPERYTRYAAAFADRYPWVSWYTPVNEPFISAYFSAGVGWWNERETSDAAFVRALDGVATCAIEGMAAIRSRRPDAIFLQSDACESYLPASAGAEVVARLRQEQSYLGFDLTYGRPVSPAMRIWLAESGMSDERVRWFEDHGSSDGCIMGLDYYALNERLVDVSGAITIAPRRGFGALAREMHDRYGLPFMLAETNHSDAMAVDWLTETWNDAMRLVADGLPMQGYCWYSLTDQIDWDTCMREANDRVNDLGLVDLDRQHRQVAAVYRELARDIALGNFPSLPVPQVVAA